MKRLLILLIIFSFIISAYSDDRALVLKKMKSERRVALIIGNSRYDDSPLKNPVNDARLMAKTLKELDFEVIVKTDANYADMMESIDKFGEKIRGGGVGLFYYAGHGMQIDGINYLIPIKSGISNDKQVKYKAVNSGLVLANMENAGNRMNIMILDACRNNPFSRSFRNVQNGLASMEAPKGSYVAYATGPGKVASDGKGVNGLFTESFVKALEKPGMKIEEVFKDTRALVMKETGDSQIPFTSSSIVGDFYFKLPEGNASYNVSVPDVKMPVDGGFSLDDLQKKDNELAEKEKKAKLAWDGRLNSMESAYNKVKNYESSTKIDENKVAAWQMFKNSFSDDNPYTIKDEEMRKYAESRISALNNQLAMTKKVEPKKVDTNKTTSSNGRYSRAYEIVTDSRTGLMWQDDKGAANREYKWYDAISYCKNLYLGGYSDWRLPNIEELKSLIDNSRTPAISEIFQNVNSSNYWSSTTDAVNPLDAWFVNFNYGLGNYGLGNYVSKSNDFYARCVRGGQ